MKIVVLKSSGNTHGSSNLLADEFIRGAKESDHTITEIDVFRANVKSCTGCVACGYEGTCVQRDDMTYIRRTILDSDMMLLARPACCMLMTSRLSLRCAKAYCIF